MMFRNGAWSGMEPDTRFTEDDQEHLVERHFKKGTVIIEGEEAWIPGKQVLRLSPKDYRALRKIEKDFFECEAPIEQRYSQVCGLAILACIIWISATYYFFGPPRVTGDYLVFLAKGFSNLILPLTLMVRQINRALRTREQSKTDLAEQKATAQQQILDHAETGIKARELDRYQILPLILGPKKI